MRIFLSIILTLGFTILHAQDSCKITYISNEGFLIETQGKKVLSNHFKEVDNITIFEQKMDFIYYETSR